MGNSLQEQLLKAGLSDKKKAAKAKKAKYTTQRQQRLGATVSPDESKRQAQQAMASRAERDRELNQRQREAAQRKAIAAQIGQLIEMNRLPGDAGDLLYRFTADGKLRQLYVNEVMQRQLSEGRLAIVRSGESFELVPAGVARKIQDRDPAVILVLNERTEAEPDNEDDPYADFQVPDDLMW